MDEFGLSSLRLTKEDFLKQCHVVQLGYEPLRIDILTDTEGVPFEDAWQAKKQIVYDDVVINVIGLEHLLILKAIAGRKQDLADIEKLKARNKQK